MDSREFAAWLAYDRISPIGAERADLRAALVAMFSSKIPNAKFEDFLLRFDGDEAKPQSAEEIAVLLKQAFRMHKGKKR